ncbi:MAG: ATP-binding protein, partial [Deltaproteobacteria bacterium]|nr:ATP-binding protein [Deltaproteobacteria bacterium]
MLKDITIENYRLFEKFHLEGMTQINLLVGTNNSGKSSLLEAIYLLV